MSILIYHFSKGKSHILQGSVTNLPTIVALYVLYERRLRNNTKHAPSGREIPALTPLKVMSSTA